MVLVPVRVDDVRYRLVGQLSQRREAFACRAGSQVGIDDDDVLGIDDEDTVRIDEDPRGFLANRGVDPVGNLLNVKPGRHCVGR